MNASLSEQLVMRVVFIDILCLLQTSAGATMLTDVTYWGLLVPFFYRDKFGLALVCRQSYFCTYYSYYAFVVLDSVVQSISKPCLDKRAQPKCSIYSSSILYSPLY